MSSLKILLLIGLLALGAGILLIWFYYLPEKIEKPAEIPVQPVTRKMPVPDSRFERTARDAKIQTLTDNLLPLFDKMPPVPVYLKDDPILKTGTNTETSNAYTYCDKGEDKGEFPTIFVKKIYYQTANPKRLTNTLKHELTHAWLCRQHLMSTGHTAEFRQKFKQAGGWGMLAKED